MNSQKKSEQIERNEESKSQTTSGKRQYIYKDNTHMCSVGDLWNLQAAYRPL